MITGDPSFGPGHPRYELQKEAVEQFDVVYWGRGALSPDTKEDAYDVVTTQDPFYRGIVGMRLAKKMNIRLNVQVHADLNAQGFLKKRMAKKVLKKADSIRVVSEKIREQVEEIGVTAPITVLPVFVDTARFSSIERTPSDVPTILWIGRFESEKYPLRAISIHKEVWEHIPEVKLIMLGAGSLEDELKEVADNSISFPGHVDPVEYLETATVVLSTSRAESWGASIVEALAAGVPVVAPDVGIAKEAGAIVVPRDQLTDAVISVLKEKPVASLNIATYSKEEWIKKWQESLS